MRIKRILLPAVFSAVWAAVALAQAPQQINISQDLVTLGIAARNAAPNSPGQDARPLLQAAIQYASSNGIGTIVADPGAYWFLTSQFNDRYLVIGQASNLTLDLQGSDIYLKNNFLIGFDLENCQNVTLANFTIDYVQLPYTQVQLTGVTGRTISYQTIAGWPSPTTLRSRFGSTDYWGIVLRGGAVPPNTNRLPLALPTDPTALQVNVDSSPWTQPGVLGTYQPGDIVVVTLKDGDAPIYVAKSDSITLRGIDVHASGTLGVHLDATSNSTVSHVRVMPRPGTDRLISTNADGIHFSFIQAGNHVVSNYVTRTMDDAIAVNSPFLAFVNSATGTRTVSITRNYQARFPNGTNIDFIDPATGTTYGPFQLVSQNPRIDAPLNYNNAATYTFNTDLPALQNGYGIIFHDAPNRGQGTVVENNLVEDTLFARGIFLGGVNGVTIQKNTIRRTDCGGIVIHQDLDAYPSAANQNILVTGNTIDAAIGPSAVGTGAITALGSIFVLATDSSFIPLPIPTATNITITNNYISNAGRSAIWAGNVDGGTIQGNTIAGFNIYPQLALWGISQSFATQLQQDFTQSVVLHTSRNVSVQKGP